MPSFFSKLGISSKRKNNPYLNPHHPGHAPLPQPISKPTSRSQPSLPLRPASPREAHDLLAEARQVANRDPVTGRRLPQPTVLHQTASETNVHANARVNGALNAMERLGPSQERSAYLNRAMQSTQTTGSRYELFAQEERRRRDEEIRLIRARGGLEYYAPERSVSEFYAGGVRD
ncbi:hypothetical protein FB567DRAFT_522667 [Paraphoma chrysanthemicola]|uniref:Uncharacterized protein n=1 Tax=Paraphoma chrysanthemicola TaxID=798071 RepID=A0A8K0W0P3_9PLEO|nr:hypothetical protein FB567DRAFT_522667 [Paraphoma chrysanthemicola]